jgi:hypothetical protein
MLNAALIVDSNFVSKWQQDALDAASDLLNFRVILLCKNTQATRNYFKHFLYYILNYFTLKNHLTAGVALRVEDIRVIEFDSIYEGAWQKIPAAVSSELRQFDIDVVIKLGMSLLRIDENLVDYKIFSYHHGDPSLYRGRPAGFYELLNQSNSVGTIVQELSNKLDAGKVWAICHSKAYHHSYKKTAINFYTNSRFLLRKALLNYLKNTPSDTPTNGVNYKLPSNFLTLKFLLAIGFRKIIRLGYGAFFEKKWNIVTFEETDILHRQELQVAQGKKAQVAAGYNFYADPLFSVDGKSIRLEGLSSLNGLGEILEIDAKTLMVKDVLLKGGHFSYPYSFQFNGCEYLLPEVASHSAPYALKHPFKRDDKVP